NVVHVCAERQHDVMMVLMVEGRPDASERATLRGLPGNFDRVPDGGPGPQTVRAGWCVTPGSSGVAAGLWMLARGPPRPWVRWDPSGRPDVPAPSPGGQSVTEVDSGRAAGPSPAQVRLEDPAVVRAWAAGASAALQRERAAIDRVNVFPVADADTGTNLSLTLREGELAVRAAPEQATGAQLLATLARAAVLGARGNSGVILSEWLRGLAVAARRGGTAADLLGRAAASARSAVERPAEGTILTAADAAAAAAR